MMNHQVSSDDQSFKHQFESGVITPADFNHRAHVRLAYIYLCENDLSIASKKMRGSLQVYLSYYELEPSKYHETMTRAWLMAVKHFMVHTALALSADDFIEANSRLLDGTLMLTHYSEAVLFSDGARWRFVEPDLAAISEYA